MHVSALRVGWLLLSAFTLGFSTVSPAAADDGRTLSTAARSILKSYCHRCHGQEGSVEGGMNYVIDLKALVARRKVIPGNAGRSRLIKRVAGVDNPMPPEEEKARPSKEEIAVLEQWIQAGAPDVPAPPRPRVFLAEADVLRFIATDLHTINKSQQRFVRYFTIHHLYNADLAEDELRTYRHGLAKLVNCLSWEPDIAVPRAVDPAQTIFRIDLRDYRWSTAGWQRVLELYPYGVVYNSPVARFIYTATECDLPYVRADWFVFAASRPPLYHDLLQLPRDDQELERELHVDVPANIHAERVARAGFNSSGVSRNNRLIERHRSAHGAYWKSYDFAGNTGRQNLFAHPLGPGKDETCFQQDGGEIIFNLPNGLQAYLLVDGKGRRIDEGPTKIVSVKNKADPTVINGVSCMFCHARGLIDKIDQIRAHVDNNPTAFSDVEAGQIRALYPPEAEFKGLLEKDRARFRAAVTAAGAPWGQTEPVVALAGRFEAELDLRTATAELGLTPALFLSGLDRYPELAQRLGALKAPGGTVQRQVFAGLFADLVRAYRIGTHLPTFRQQLAAATEAIRRNARNSSAFFERGNLHFDQADFEKALGDYNEAVRLGLPGSEIYENRGMAFANRGDYDRAIEDYERALARNPTRTSLYHNRSLAYAQKGDHARAMADLNTALQQTPEDVRLYSDRGLIHTRLGELADALADYEQALLRQPDSPITLVRRGDVYQRQGRSVKALMDYAHALWLNPRFDEALQKLGQAWAKIKGPTASNGHQAADR